MEIVGYVDRFIARPGDRVGCMLSSEVSEVEARLVRLIHGDTNPKGPGFRETSIPSDIDGLYTAHRQELESGSYMRASLGLVDPLPRSFVAWIRPSIPGRGQQCILSWMDEERRGYRLLIDEDGSLAFDCGDCHGRYLRVSTNRPLRSRVWYRVAMSICDDAGAVALLQEPRDPIPDDPSAIRTTHSLDGVIPDRPEVPILLAASLKPSWGGQRRTTNHFNGKIESPSIYSARLDLEDLVNSLAQVDPETVLASWDFASDMESVKVRDISGRNRDGTLVNMPARAMTGHTWDGVATSWEHDPTQYGAVYFHDSDLEDPKWEETFALDLSEDMASGVYAFRIRGSGAEDHVPFIVETPPGQATAPLALLLPTMTYSTYANESISWQNPASPPTVPRILDRLSPEDHYIDITGLRSGYDLHSDESMVLFTSLKRPLLNMRPRYRMQLIGAPHQLGADLYIIDWLEALGYSYDIITDDALHHHGMDLLGSYRTVMTGSHPEYVTTQMWNALAEYTRTGGRLMYMGGNGFYWIVSVHPEHPHVRELRRGHASDCEPGEEFHSTTGERGGLWQWRGRPPQQIVGVGYSGEGYDHAVPYYRLPDSFDPRAGFIFEGIGDQELIGDFGLVMGGAGGFEVDRVDRLRGTPSHALRLATTIDGFSQSYALYDHVHWGRSEYQRELQAKHGPPEPGEAVRYQPPPFGSDNPLLRSDMVYFEQPGGGAVFSVGSIAWSGALSFNGHRNNVSRITDNVLRHFLVE